MKSFPFFKQLDTMDCGPTCLRMVAKYHGKSYSLQSLREKTGISREGVSMSSLSSAAETIGLRSLAVKVDFDKLANEAPFPFIAHWKQNHFVVVSEIRKNSVTIADPSSGILKVSKSDFLTNWGSSVENGKAAGIVLLFEVTPSFYIDEDNKMVSSLGFKRIFEYLFAYKGLLVQLVIGLIMGSLLQLILPFMTQSVIDIGINTHNLNFINLILFGQLMLFAGRTIIEFIRSWILLHIGSRINISILSDFFIKLLRLPMSFFDTKHQGDLLQRIGDHDKIESFLTNSVINIIFSIFTFFILGTVLSIYNITIFLLFMLGSIIYVGWILLFLKSRKALNISYFESASKSQSSILQIIDGIQDIKLNNSEHQKRWDWENIQARLFKLNMKSLTLRQIQASGALFINEGKNIFITYLAAKSVINGEITLGMMLSINYILGQLNSPIEQFISFIQTYQDAKLSLERLNDINNVANEEPDDTQSHFELPLRKNILLFNVFFSYPGVSKPILNGIDLEIPEGKVTAIVGSSGSGKTTLLKLLLKSYNSTSGQTMVGSYNLKSMNSSFWRSKCGVVMQDGFIFSDTIAKNIAVGEENINMKRLYDASKTANIEEFVEGLPLGFNTKIGAEGNGVSQGQKQRILIARAIYKNPTYLFFDEATNALDANNEKTIMENLNAFFINRTVVIVAHRLSTVKNADQIVVLEHGQIVERGVHKELTDLGGRYYNLVKNQLELGG